MSRPTTAPDEKSPIVATIRGRVWVLPFVAAALLIIDKLINLRSFSFLYTDNDAVMFWYAAEDLLHGHVRTPFWYGNRHNTLIEGFLSVPLLALGVSHEKAIPLTAGAIQLAPWFVLFIVFARRKNLLAMTLAAVFPVLLVREYQLLAGFGAGIACATPAALMAMRTEPNDWRTWFLVSALWGIAYVLNPNSAFISAPAAFASLASSHTRTKQWGAVFMGLGSAGLLWGAMQSYYWFDPHAGAGGIPEIEFRLSLLSEGLNSIGVLWSHLLPIIVRTPWAYPALWLSALVLALWYRDAWAARWVSAGMLLIFASLALTTIRYGSLNVFYSYARFYFALPVFTVLSILFSIQKARFSNRSSTILVVALCIVGIASLELKHRSRTQSTAQIIGAPLINVKFRPTAPLLKYCQLLGNIASGLDIPAIFVLRDPVVAGGCGARLYGQSDVINPNDSRTWVLRRVANIKDGTFVVTEAPPGFCERFPPSSRCRTLPIANVVLFEAHESGPIELLLSLGVKFRDF